ncbi:hypothetical protein, partial [Anabaena sp. CS-542/02]|uniref:hypothetical protein n=1 Tax=Anabaena sp. CS-542/02 TaxID=3021719 RepID=UPI0023315831
VRARLGGQGGQGDKGGKQYKVCILSHKNSPSKNHCPYKIFLVHPFDYPQDKPSLSSVVLPAQIILKTYPCEDLPLPLVWISV